MARWDVPPLGCSPGREQLSPFPGQSRARRGAGQGDHRCGGKAFFVELEVTDQEQWDAAVGQIRVRAGALHILMNIVGSNALVMLPEADIEAWNKMFEINVTATLMGIQTCAPLIRDSGGGSIVNIGSVAGITGNFSTAYSASKWALEGSHDPPPSEAAW
jgi:NAD(P)-dependent dehydrogenase (short-subunit alcohol dehydrogenase family)